jgi:hypothetical protein
MPEKKKQHFVPQFYMRNFSADTEKKKVSLYNFGSEKRIDDIPIKDQNYDDYFYGKDGEIEDALGLIEGKAADVIADIISRSELPARMSDGHITLLIFALFQAGRTPTAAAEIEELSEKLMKEIMKADPKLTASAEGVHIKVKNAPAMSLQTVAATHVFALDLKWKLLLNNTNRLYITSDHPAVMYNQFLEKRKTIGSNIGLAVKGMQFFLPLGPRHLLMIYDDGVYRIGGRKHLESTIEAQELDVSALNALQTANADELLYFSPDTEPDHVIEAIVSGRMHHVVEKASVKTYEGTTAASGKLIHSSRTDLRIGLALPSVVIQPSAAGPPLGNGAVIERDPEFVEMCRDFCNMVQAGRYTVSQFSNYMRDRFTP